MVLNQFGTAATTFVAQTTTTSTSGSGGLALPPKFIALGIGAIVIMTVAWFFLKNQKGSGSD